MTPAEMIAEWLDRPDVSENRAADEVRERAAEVNAMFARAAAAAEARPCRHAELPDTLWARLSAAEAEVARLQDGCGNVSPGTGGERCRLYAGHDGSHSDGYGAEWSDPAPTTDADA